MRVVVLHDVGDPAAGQPWRDALERAGLEGTAPDLPGHGGVEPFVDGSFGAADVALATAHLAGPARAAGRPPVLVGHAVSGFGAELLAAAGRAQLLVLIDGLGPAWLDDDGIVADQQRWLRDVFSDNAALAPHAAPGVDPRLRHALPSVWQRSFTEERRAAITVPVVAIETPAAPTPPADREGRLASFGRPARHVPLPDADPDRVLAVVADVLG